MTAEKGLLVASAVAGMLGAALIFIGSFAFEAPMTWTSKETAEDMRARNKLRALQQRAGIALIFASFLLQIIAVLAF